MNNDYALLIIIGLVLVIFYQTIKKDFKKINKKIKRNKKRSRNIQAKTEREKYTKKISDRLIKKHLPKDWVYRLNNTKCRLGQTCPHKKEINISKLFINGKYGTKKEIKNTILHEIAHALDFEKHGYRKTKNGRNIFHDKVWKKLAMDIGCDGARCGKM